MAEAVTLLTSEKNFLEELTDAKEHFNVVVLEFSVDWEPHFISLSAAVDVLAGQLVGVKFIRLNGDAFKPIVEGLEVKKFTTFMVYYKQDDIFRTKVIKIGEIGELWRLTDLIEPFLEN